MGSITNLIVKLQKSKFARRFQYEPYIIKSVEYVNPTKGEKLLVVYRETDYFRSLALESMSKEDYFSWNVEDTFDIDNVEVDKIVFFISTYYLNRQDLNKALDRLKENGEVFCICYLRGSKFFETTLKITDKKAFNGLGDEIELFRDFEILDIKEFQKEHIKAVKLRRNS
ncbi:hypothetical protein [Hippea maritima]|uniref:Uncharacterized protein n=1 Tax=Hippea maritima (strain ATCC 700847 / DSM 10411 / MH2) TaxID=760142 RepID=F2LVI0_HIPMA|nr:hypothetical protein [Hippea maritima]AEA33764.1 hypothetical protein Hipma_0794 [Hippea maritima DSM 10411]